MPSKKQKIALEPVFHNLEFSRRADELIGVIKRHYLMIEGVKADNETVEAVATNIIKERLK